jgi:hypothetical protein
MTVKQACIDAYDSAQVQGEMERLLAAKESLRYCASDACPDKMRQQCAAELSALQARVPSFVLTGPAAQDPSVQVWLDGAPVQLRPGEPLEVDPGMHKLRVQAPGRAAVELRLELAAGQQRQQLRLPAPETAPSAPPVAAGPSRVRHPALVYGLAGMAVLAAGSFGYFGLTGRKEYLRLKDTCAPNCTESQSGAAHTNLVLADISLAVSAASVAAALLVYGFDRTPVPQPFVGVGLVPGGAAASMRGAF